MLFIVQQILVRKKKVISIEISFIVKESFDLFEENSS
jgi:hypothetical protein